MHYKSCLDTPYLIAIAGKFMILSEMWSIRKYSYYLLDNIGNFYLSCCLFSFSSHHLVVLPLPHLFLLSPFTHPSDLACITGIP